MTSKSKAKGSNWERDIAKFLSDLYGESFVRVPNSGAYIGGANSIRKESLDSGQIRGFKGDIIPPSNWIHFNCEAKNYKDFPFHQLYQGPIKILELWLSQLLQAADSGDLNILIIKITRKGKFIITQNTLLNCNQNYSIYNSTNYGTWYIQDYDQFWQHNQSLVKNLSLAR